MKKFFRNVIIILVVVLMLAGVLAPVFVTVPIYAEDIESLENSIAEREKELIAQKSKQANIKEQLSEEVAKLDDYRQQIKNLEAEIESMKTAIATSEEEIKRLQASIEEREKKLRKRKRRLRDIWSMPNPLPALMDISNLLWELQTLPRWFVVLKVWEQSNVIMKI